MLGFVAMLKRLLLAVLFAGLSSTAFAAAPSLFDGLFGPEDGSHVSFGSHSAKAKARAGDHVLITVDISTQEMTVETDWGTLYTWDVSTGRSGYSTPTGNFRPIRMHTCGTRRNTRTLRCRGRSSFMAAMPSMAPAT